MTTFFDISHLITFHKNFTFHYLIRKSFHIWRPCLTFDFFTETLRTLLKFDNHLRQTFYIWQISDILTNFHQKHSHWHSTRSVLHLTNLYDIWLVSTKNISLVATFFNICLLSSRIVLNLTTLIYFWLLFTRSSKFDEHFWHLTTFPYYYIWEFSTILTTLIYIWLFSKRCILHLTILFVIWLLFTRTILYFSTLCNIWLLFTTSILYIFDKPNFHLTTCHNEQSTLIWESFLTFGNYLCHLISSVILYSTILCNILLLFTRSILHWTTFYDEYFPFDNCVFSNWETYSTFGCVLQKTVGTF